MLHPTGLRLVVYPSMSMRLGVRIFECGMVELKVLANGKQNYSEIGPLGAVSILLVVGRTTQTHFVGQLHAKQ